MTTIPSPKRESALQSEVIKWCRTNNIYCINVHAGGMTGRGTPDLILCYKGQFVGVELKVGKNKMSDAQEIRRSQILKSGGSHLAPRSLSEFIEELNKL